MARRRISLLFAIVTCVTAVGAEPVLSGSRPLCFGKRATIVGTNGSDRIEDTRRADVIVTLGGNDYVEATQEFEEPKDRICTGTGADRVLEARGSVNGGGGPDELDLVDGRGFGGSGNDQISEDGHQYGGPGDDDLSSDDGNLDRMVGGPGNDRYTTSDTDTYGYLNFDFVSYHSAPRPIRVNLATGVIRGWGRDRLLGPDGPVLSGSRFGDRFFGGPAVASPNGGKGDDVFTGTGEFDGFSGGPGADRIEGRGGHDILTGGPGDDRIIGGPGRDDIVTFTDGGRVAVDLKRGFAHGQGEDVLRGFEEVWGSHRADRLLGSDRGDELVGWRGADVIRGRGGNDEISGVWGRNERLFGNGGNDNLDADHQSSLLDGGFGYDVCYGGTHRNCEVS